ncbi:MAG: alpha-ketoacid dehydrogenase subunit alpha/beta [Flammeovirgaceae bacterium]
MTTTQQALPIAFKKKRLSKAFLLDTYKHLLKPRMIEEKMLILLRQGKISKWFSGIGQEAISVGATLAMDQEEYLFPMHRNLGLFTTRGVPLHRLFGQFQGKHIGFTKGRDRSFHFGSQEHHIVGMISHLGPQLSVGSGVALADLLDHTNRVTLAFTGDGATSEGEFHEAMNVAAVWNLPIIFIIEHNGYGLSTPNNEQFVCKQLMDKGIGYGMEAIKIDGNNVLEVYETIKKLRQDIIKKPRPVLVEAMTFRMRGHEEASGTKYVPQELFDEWGKKDPVTNYEQFLKLEGILSDEQEQEIRAEIKQEIEEGLRIAYAEEVPEFNLQHELNDVYAPFEAKVTYPKTTAKSPKRLVDAISDGLRQSMEQFPETVVMGQDVAEYGGVFKVTQGFVEQFGKGRVRNTPLCESAILGIGLGLSIKQKKAIVEMQFADFVTCGFNQIVNNLAKIHYRWGQHADVVVRMPTGAGVAAGPFHSQSNEAWFYHTPGLKVVFPASPYDAKGLLAASIEDPNPVIFFEHKALYRAVTEEVPDDYYTLPIGKANLVAEGNDLSIITYGMGVHWAKEIMDEMSFSADILDLRTLLPWDKEAVRATVSKTNKVLVCQEDCLTGGIAGDIASWISEECFEELDAPVMRVGSLDTPVPFAPTLEKGFLPKDRLRKKIKQLFDY